MSIANDHKPLLRPFLSVAGSIAVVACYLTISPANRGLAEMVITEKERSFWSFQPIKQVKPPFVANMTWSRRPIDLFILAKLESKGLSPAPAASKRELIRRLAFDLSGLPPNPDEVEAFVNDTSPSAYEKLVDHFLNSPAYGERWGQHWLDVVRYAETEGFEYDRLVPDGWRYRDWVIEAFNRDMPYDQFVMAQLAGDELAPNKQEMQIAAGFHRIGAVRRNAGNQEVTGSRNEVLTERTDIIGAAFLGLTVGCARCHDHKFDPVRQKDYYQLQAFLAATQENDIPLASPEDHAVWKARTDAANEEIKKLKEALKHSKGEERKRLQEQVEQAEDRLPAPLASIASITNDFKNRTAIHVLKRGEWDKKGEPVGIKPLSVLVSETAAELPDDTPNPRTALARWLADVENPLTARVMVNRIWQHHFGQGIVKTANDFGANGDRPSHPELLDYLASEFVANGWRLKPLHRMILLSNAYQQASHSSQEQLAKEKDPENRLLWSFHRRRLEAEELRDAMLAISGKLNRKASGPSVLLSVDQELVNQLYKPSQWTVTGDKDEQYRRSIYLIAKRNLRLPFMQVFDQPMLLTSCSRRESSTHAPQALELLNGKTANELAMPFAERLRREAGSEPAQQVERAYRLAMGRDPTKDEKKLAVEFLREQPLQEFALAMFNLNAFLYVD